MNQTVAPSPLARVLSKLVQALLDLVLVSSAFPGLIPRAAGASQTHQPTDSPLGKAFDLDEIGSCGLLLGSRQKFFRLSP
jgi:hypothetical protein